MGSRGDSSHAISSTSGMSLDEQEPRLLYCKSLQDKELDKYVCTGTLNTSLPCLAWGLYAATTDDLRISGSILYESEFMDAKVVRVFEAASADDSFKFSGVKYIKTQMPVQSTHVSRDAVYFEIMCAACTVRIAYTPLFLQSEPSQKAMQERKICAQCIRVTKESLSAKYPLHAIKLPSQSTNISCPDEHNTLNEGDISKVNHRLGGISTSDTTATTKNDSPPPRQCVSMDEGNCQHEHDYLDNPFQSMALTRPTAARYRRKTPGPTSEGFIVCQFNGSDLETIHTTENGLTLSIAHQH
ncbi:hypothetical protein DYB28_012326 [Aphanomyces astaci]|uniref:Uncharacterized protein n=1 Tax=Aphanomyces astaci TaxID=112090 RepID=A0A9X8EC64_APHAT|nr:hypothetical protein DYB28_012326 [Aphanomyces astaci]